MTAEQALQHPWIQKFKTQYLQKKALTDNPNIKILLDRLINYKRPRLIKKEAIKILIRVLEEKHMTPLKQGFHQIDKQNLGMLTIDTLE